ncbi:MAG: VWA domain-containing protein [Microscillaceae bacterium]|nr:VWA domain-containing protein [Microscillaceae bacterium]
MSETDFTQFIEFGQIFDRSTREYLVQYIRQKISPKIPSKAFLTAEDPGFEYLKAALDKIFDRPELLKLAQENTHLAGEIIQDVLQWMRRTAQKNQSENPYLEEQKELERWFTRPTFMWVRHWYKLTNYLRDIYKPDEINTRFYEKKFEEITAQIDAYSLERDPKAGIQKYEKELAQLDIVAEDLLDRWQSLLTAKRLQFELENIDKQREEFCALLYAKIEEFIKLLSIISPFQSEIGRFWDMSRGLWQETGFDVLSRYAELLQKEDSIRELADLLGKMREAEIELEEEIYENVISRKTWVDDLSLKSEIGGVYESNDIQKVLPSEVSLLGYPETETVFLKKFADHNLLTYLEKGQKLVNSNKITFHTQQKQKRKEKGPFIICIDTSGSMEGLPEQIAKVLCFAIIKMAALEQRKCFLISFSIGIKTIQLHELADSLDQIVKFLSMSFHGGTDVTPAMIATIDMLHSHDYKDADVLVVSDFVMFEIREEILKKIRAVQAKGTLFHSLTISKMANPEIVAQFDNNWMYNPEDRGIIKQLVRDLRSIA